MEWKRISVGPVQANCYLLWNEDKEGLIIDPGSEGERIIKEVEAEGFTPIAILLTHAHFDHIGALDVVRENWSLPVYLHQEEFDWLENPDLNGSSFFPMIDAVSVKKADHKLNPGEDLRIGTFTCKVLHTPGHSPGSVSFSFEESGLVVSGDALFMGSIGRTDLPGGNHEQLIESIHEQLLTLDEETEVLSGHGPSTTIGEEMNTNPFLNGF
ncbi:MBL fold metallo-hydrolase [Pseudalkalibacillus berkeleyi]|uniref:MBL fold metallo-hydrolase n=1 Tax=Pseudalkalibacillus berkeleyi TaxID=1069813 RepID=A0ABS9GYP4_9BACL|nr:MBL fold metallo-hydrolase [Pseudalkalibacillus berkeleyi]MCF6137892.1 MBL fold metallo-hydrolase [Pseudalkalibacillus berkeleyi]